eukprot:GSChrysophyteH1.ASY1.ANO1.662.1 assembled CDS
MHLVSWNVASWTTTLKHIYSNHKPENNAKSISAQEAGLEMWMKELMCDILCLQEVKLERSKVQAMAKQLLARSDEYDTFFCCPSAAGGSSNGKNKSNQTNGGLNGVATYVKKGRTLRATSTPLDGGGPLDSEGRCLMTDHGSFVVFNVYIPNASGGSRLVFKQKFQQALQAAMRAQRSIGKHVMLVGDFNLTYRPVDCHRDWRLIPINHLLSRSSSNSVGADAMPAFVAHVASEWPGITKSLLSMDYNVDLIHAQMTAPFLQSGRWVNSSTNEVTGAVCDVEWMKSLLMTDNMIDAFAAARPYASDRFTCWNQYTNDRYSNIGSRIDYTLVDAALWDADSSLAKSRKGLHPSGHQEQKAALDACTNFGSFQPVPSTGGGIQKPPQWAYCTHLRRSLASSDDSAEQPGQCARHRLHTGILYTPPEYSDHVGITLFMKDGIWGPPLALSTDAETRLCQPQAQQATLAGFFASKSGSTLQSKDVGTGSGAGSDAKPTLAFSFPSSGYDKATSTKNGNASSKRKTVDGPLNKFFAPKKAKT